MSKRDWKNFYGYFVVDYDIVWNIITKELPYLKTNYRDFKRGGIEIKLFTIL